ncbi:MAG: DMT family transporter [Flavisolibacter sp.]
MRNKVKSATPAEKQGFRPGSGLRAHLAVLGTNFFFSVNYSLVKYISPSLVKPFAVNVLRSGLSMVLFWVAWLFGRTPAGIERKDWGAFFWCALTGVAINQMLFIKGLTLTSTIHAALLTLATPLLVTLFALWILKEKFSFFKALGLALGIGGSLLLILQKEKGQDAPDYLQGDLLILLNAIAYAVYFILVKPLMQQYSPLHVIRWVFTLGFLMILPFGWEQTAELRPASFSWQQGAALFAIVFTGTFLAYYFNVYAIRHIGAGPAGSYIYTQPVFAVAIAIFFLGESFSWQKLLAAACIFAGVYLVSFKKGKKGAENTVKAFQKEKARPS